MGRNMKNPIRTKIVKLTLAAMTAGLVSGCTTVPTKITVNQAKPAGTKVWAGIPDISGIAPIAKDRYLVVHDSKDKPGSRQRARIGIINISRAKGHEDIAYTKLQLPASLQPVTSDLEAVCKIPGRTNEFLMAESSYYDGRYGRMFHIRLDGDMAILEGSDQLPKNLDQFEGMACTPVIDEKVGLIMGQRGGSKDYPSGAIRWGKFDLASHKISGLESAVSVRAPNLWNNPDVRSITGLSIDANNTLWASAAVDLGSDVGWFRSIVYDLGKIYPNAAVPFVQNTQHKIWVMDGLKVEAVTNGIDGLSLSYGSEDEKLGGIWRDLPKTPTLIRAAN